MANIKSIGGNPIVLDPTANANTITDEMLTQTGGIISRLNDLMANDGYLVYNKGTYTWSEVANTWPAATRFGSSFTVNGTFGGTGNFYKLSETGSTNRSTSASTARSWAKEITLKAGRTYIAKLTTIAGSVTVPEDGFWCVRLLGTSPIDYRVYDGTPLTITPATDEQVNVCLYATQNVAYTSYEGVFTVRDITDANLTTDAKTVTGAINELDERTTKLDNASGLAYPFPYIVNRVTDSYGNLYFGYISKDAKAGVCCRRPDGSIIRRDLWQSDTCDDHNAPSVILVSVDGEQHVCVIGSTGHNVDSKINCFIASQPNTIMCSFTDKSHTITAPTDYVYQNTYSEAFWDTSHHRIINFFRIKQRHSGSFVMIWMCATSDDLGDTWKVYRVMATGQSEELFYLIAADSTANNYTKRLMFQTNTTNQSVRPLKTGYINTNSGNISNGNGTNIQKPMTLMADGELAYDTNVTIATYDDFTTVVNTDGYHRFRILDVWKDAVALSSLRFLYVKSATAPQDHHDITDWVLYHYDGGTVTEVAHVGLAHFVGSCYMSGACFVSDKDHVCYGKNTTTTVTDGPHELRMAVVDDGAVTSDELIKASGQLIARPARYDVGSLCYLTGRYREGQGDAYTTWHLGVGFIDHL